jgi:hypothetical protein
MTSNVRVDDLSKYYNSAATSNTWSDFFFWLSMLCSFFLFFTQDYEQLKYVINIVFIVVTLLFFIYSNLTSLYFLRKAEEKRSTHLLTNSLGVSLDDEETNLYYNNAQPHSIARLGLNIFENSLHSLGTSTIMLRRNFIIIVLYVVIWFVCMLNRSTSLDLIAIISQTLLTTTLVTNFFKLLILKFGFDAINKECRNLFINGIQDNVTFNSQILNIFVRYESLKASMGIMLSSKFFFKHVNPSTTQEWEKIKRNLGLH